MTRVLVTGSGGPTGRALLTALSGRGIDVLGVDIDPKPLGGIEVIRGPAAGDPCFVEQLNLIAGRHGVSVIVPTVSDELPVLARRASGMEPRVVLGCRSAVAIADDKWLTADALALAGVEVARSFLPSQLPSDRRNATLGTPFLSKPRVGRGSRGVVVHDGPAGVEGNLDDSVVLQEFASGTEYVVEAYLSRRVHPPLVGRSGGDDVAVAFEKRGLAHGNVGYATDVERVHASELVGLALDAAWAIGLDGPIDVDIRRRGDGVAVVLEINARFGAHVGCAPELVDALLADIAKEARP